MLDAWKRIDDDFNRLIRSLTAAIADRNAEQIVGAVIPVGDPQHPLPGRPIPLDGDPWRIIFPEADPYGPQASVVPGGDEGLPPEELDAESKPRSEE